MTTVLPICNPPITTYQRTAFPLSIALTDLNAYKWFYSNYIQLSCANQKYFRQRDPEQYALHLDFYAPMLDEFDALDHVVIDTNSQLFLFNNFNFICEAIKQEYYIYTDADMFYIPNNPWYNRFHFCHDLLINGYEDNGNIHFYAYGNNKLERSVMTYKEFLAGYFSEYCNEMHYRTRAILYRRVKKDYHLDFPKIMWHMQDYLAGIESFAREHSTVFHPDTLSTIGVEIYDDFIQLCNELCNAKTIKIRRQDVYCLYEHKKTMADRICYLIDHDVAHADSDLIVRFRQLEKSAYQIMLLGLKINSQQESRKDQLDALGRIRNDFERLRLDEISVWEDFLKVNKDPEIKISNGVTLQETNELHLDALNHIQWDLFYYNPYEASSAKHFLAMCGSKPIGFVAFYNIDMKNVSAGLEFVPFEDVVSDESFISVMEQALILGFDRLGLNKIYVNIIRDNYPMFDLFHHSNFVFEAIHRDQFLDSFGVLHDTVFFSMLKSEWIQKRIGITRDD